MGTWRLVDSRCTISGLNANANWSCKLNIRGSLYWGDPETTPTDTGSVYRGTKTYTVSCTNKTVTITPTSVQTFNTETEIWNREGYAVGCGIESITITDFVRN